MPNAPVKSPPSPINKPASQAQPRSLTVRARGSIANGVGPVMVLMLDGHAIGQVEVASEQWSDYTFSASRLNPGSRLSIVFSNDAVVGREDRNLHIAWVAHGSTLVPSFSPIVTHSIKGQQLNVEDTAKGIGRSDLKENGALNIVWPTQRAKEESWAGRVGAARFLHQASFGATSADIDRVILIGVSAWIAEQRVMPVVPAYLDVFQAMQDRGKEFAAPNGSQHTPVWNVHTFWREAVTAPDQLRQRMAFALQQVLTVSMRDMAVFSYGRAHAALLDNIYLHALGSFRSLLDVVSMSPVMGLYLTHLGNQPADGIGRSPDENFARELMQLFTIGLVELNADGTPRLGADGQPIETYNNDDVMALARVFTGWSWEFDNKELTQKKFLHGKPDRTATGAARMDIRPMKSYSQFHDAGEKQMFRGKPWAVTIPAGTPGPRAVQITLDALFNHPNTAPFISRQLIQRLTTSNPSAPYVKRVAAVFTDNGQGQRGDLGAVAAAILLDTEARPAHPGPRDGKLREPVLRMTQLMRAFDVRSASGDWRVGWELRDLLQHPLNAPSVFGFFRPGYVPPNTKLASHNMVAPEMQIVSESTTAAWVNRAETLISWGMGGHNAGPDLTLNLQRLESMMAKDPLAALEELDILLHAGRMTRNTKLRMLDAMAGVASSSERRHELRAQMALFLAAAAPGYLVQV